MKTNKAIRAHSISMTREAAEEYSASLAQIGEGWWRQIAWAQQQGVPMAMGLSLPAWREKYYGHMKVSLEARREAVAELAEAGLSNVKIAEVLGVGETTVRRDKDPSPNGEKQVDHHAEISPNGEIASRIIEIRRIDFRELLGSLTDVDAIITDPPYERNAIPLYGELARSISFWVDFAPCIMPW